jgi:hypothetical protein
MNCPVCNFAELSENTTVCPQCHSDLEAIHLTFKIGRKSRQKSVFSVMVSVLAIFFLAFLVVGFINKGDLTKKSAMEMTPEEITSLKADLENLTALNNDLQTSNVNLLSKLADLEKTTARKEQIYVVSKGETLSAIATKIFGTGNKFREIAIDNNLPNPDQLTPGQKLIIKF